MKWFKRKDKSRPRRRPSPWDWLRPRHAHAADSLDLLHSRGELTEVDYARIGNALEPFKTGAVSDQERLGELAAAIVAEGAGALAHPSGLRRLPGRLMARHNLEHGQVRVGTIVPSARAPETGGLDFAVGQDALRTSMLVIGPPGSGKTRGFALPVVEHLSLGALAGQSSLVVIDPKGDDFDFPGWFDHVIDPLAPTTGFDLFGGAEHAETAADRLASALLPPQAGDDVAYFMDASRNALYACLSPYVDAFRRFPSVRELLALLRVEQGTTDHVKSGLKGHGSKAARALLDTRRDQASGRHDPAASMVERLALLHRPRLERLLDGTGPKFRMTEIDHGVRVRFALAESEYPEAGRIIARLAVSQFVQVASSSKTNRNLFKGLVMDEAGRYVDDYAAKGVQRLRSNNAGLVLLSQSISDFRADVRSSVFGSAGCKAVFGAVDPGDADLFSRFFGDEWISEISVSRDRREGRSWSRGTTRGLGGIFDYRTQRGRTRTESESRGYTYKKVERARWTPSDIMTGIPTGRCLAVLTDATGHRFGPVEVDLRA
ncbi:type IV secretory system conjugative DNA transfer family protein [Salininema proteolyticum]|uniref:Type IV secretory system conjugative DNA transfer family protein n=1 Tax=Salininema proteolyticum TaxID=1607685 RepID=A0ABV8TVM2_9ACTN